MTKFSVALLNVFLAVALGQSAFADEEPEELFFEIKLKTAAIEGSSNPDRLGLQLYVKNLNEKSQNLYLPNKWTFPDLSLTVDGVAAKPTDTRAPKTPELSETVHQDEDAAKLKSGETKLLADGYFKRKDDGAYDLKWGPYYYENLRGDVKITAHWRVKDNRYHVWKSSKIKKAKNLWTGELDSNQLALSIR